MVWDCVRDFNYFVFFQKSTKTTSNNFSLSFSIQCCMYTVSQIFVAVFRFVFEGRTTDSKRIHMSPWCIRSHTHNTKVFFRLRFSDWLRVGRRRFRSFQVRGAVDVLIVQIPHTVNIQKKPTVINAAFSFIFQFFIRIFEIFVFFCLFDVVAVNDMIKQ